MTRHGLRVLVVLGVTLLIAATVATPASAKAQGRPHPHRKPWPITITIQTQPKMPNIQLRLDNTTLTTDQNGRAAFTAQHNFEQHTLTLLDPSVNFPDRRYRFTRWAGQRDPDQAFRTTVTGLPMRANYTITAAFTVQYQVIARFVDQSGRDLDAADVTSATIRSDDGNVIDFPIGSPLWLDGQAPTYSKSTLELHQVSYSLQSVIVNGTNVVDAGKQRFQPAAVNKPTFVTQFHDLTIRAHDALFGGAAGRAVRVTYPDDVVHTIPFGAGHAANLDNLPRGQYSMDVVTGGGVAFAQHLRLSRANTVDIIVVSRTDEAVVALALVLLAFGLLIIGRPRLRRVMAKRARAGLRWLKSVRPEHEVPPV